MIGSGVLPDGKARFISLKDMSLTSPNDASGSDIEISWGGNGNNIQALTDFTVNVTGETSADGTNKGGYLPFDDFYVYRKTPHMPSPKLYFSAYSSQGSTSDLDGKANTSKILAIDNAASTNWQTAASIENSTAANVHPAAQVCWRFCPGVTNQGDWYLPSEGELGFIMPNFSGINSKISDVNGVPLEEEYGYYWSSTEYGPNGCWYLYTNFGQINTTGKANNNYVRAFFAL